MKRGQIRTGSANWLNLLSLAVLLSFTAFALIPAVNSGRSSSNRSVCQNNMRNCSTALLNFENSHGEFPGYANVLTTTDGKINVDLRTGKLTAVGWPIMTLRQLDRPDLQAAWRTPVGQATPATEAQKRTPIERFVCPSGWTGNQVGMRTKYVVNCGMKDSAGSATMPRDWGGNGVFFDRFSGDERVVSDPSAQIPIVSMSIAYIMRHDGQQNTILVSENVDAGNYTDTDEIRVGMLWDPHGTIDRSKNPPHLAPSDPNMRMNAGIGKSAGATRRAAFARPSSYHLDGVNMVFCDGHLKFISNQIDYYVYCLLMSPNGQRLREPGSKQGIPGFDVKIDD